MEWNSSLYDKKHDFVAEYGKDLLTYIPDHPAQSILDLGCGTGTLTMQLAELGSRVMGVDSSPSMIEKAGIPGSNVYLLGSPVRFPAPKLEPW